MTAATIYIPTYRRVAQQETWSWLPDSVRDRTYLVAQPDEVDTLDMLGYNVLSCPVEGISNKRQWILDQHQGSRLIMLDDDLCFAARRQDDPSKFTKPAKGSGQLEEMLRLVEHQLDYVPFAGMASRSGANRVVDPYRLNGRIYDTWAMDVDVTRREGIVLNRLPLMEDFDTALQFLTKGFPNLVLNSYVKDDKGSNTSGGCSTFRTAQAHALAALDLATLWPEYVALVSRPPWKGMEGPRTDVRIAWQKAHQAGARRRAQQGLAPVPVPRWTPEGILHK